MAVVGKKRKKGTTYYVVTWWNGKAWTERSGTDKREAERLDARRKREVADGNFEPTDVAPKAAIKTVADYVAVWGKSRTNITAGHDRQNLARFMALRDFAALAIDDVRPKHVIAALTKLKRSGQYSAKTLQNSYGSLRTMFRDARINELVGVDPCVLPRNFFGSDGPSPEREAYSRAEAAVLVSHHAIPSPVRVLNALCLLAGLREGEACGRRWRDIDTEAGPLWAMTVASQYNGLALKTKKPRMVPVHPELAAILQEWAAGDFVALMGRAPEPDDFIVPYLSPRSHGGFYTRSIYYKAFTAGCVAASIRPRSLHSTRHTMVTMARRGGADRQVLSTVTHNARGDMIDRYTHHEWEPLCRAVLAIGSLFDARQGPRGLPGSSQEMPLISEGENSSMHSESLESASGERASIPRASTESRAKNGSEKEERQSPRQSLLDDSAGLGALLLCGDDEGEAFEIALGEQHGAVASRVATAAPARPPAKAKPYIARRRSEARRG